MKQLSRAILLSMVTGISFAQSADTLIYAEGRILNSTTKEPIAARISYQSLPYGNTVGMLKGTSFRFPLFNNERYEVTVEADGFATARYMLDPAEANTERKVVRDVELGLPTTAARAAETAHTVGKVMNLDNLIFETGRARIAPESYQELDQVALMLNTYPKMVIQLEGHTDTRGNAKENMKLSEARVESVRTYLVSKGINKKKVKTKAFGGSQPLSRENTEEAHRMNRRVQVRIIEN